MRARIRRGVAHAYRLTCRPPGSEEIVEVRPGLTVRQFVLDWSRSGPAEARGFLDRLPEVVELEAKSVLAVGRGAGDLGVEVARRYARRVVAVDKVPERMNLTVARLQDEGASLPVDIRPYAGDLTNLGGERFDVVLAVDALRRSAADPPGGHVGALVDEMARRLVDGGLLAIRWASPWKSPYGGFIDSKLPWAHLVFPESVIFEEFRRVRPGNDARGFTETMTLTQFRHLMDDTGLECLHFASNVSDHPAASLVRALGRIPGLEEYLTLNVYGVWRRATPPDGALPSR
jgi:SAM-dependent methyltransferase